MWRKFILVWALALLTGMSAFAGINPSITERGVELDDDEKPAAVKIESLDIRVDILGNFAQTRMQAVFYNGENRELEGEFRLKMPSGSIVNGYALDIDGQLVGGVLVKKAKAEKTYTDKVRQNIDPGIAEVVDQNVYKTRIYPVAADGRRTIALEFITPIGTDGYELPLEIDSDNVSISVNGTDKKWDGGAVLRVGTQPAKTSISQHASGRKFLSFALSDKETAKLRPKRRAKARAVNIYWDRSLSRSKGGHKAERLLVFEYLRAASPKTVTFIAGIDRPDEAQSFKAGAWNELDKTITALDYDGASDLTALLGAEMPKADICLVVTDGHATIGGAEMPSLDCTVFTISKDEKPNHGYLSLLAEQGGGAFISQAVPHEKGLELLQNPASARLVESSLGGMKRINVAGRDYMIAPLGTRTPRSVSVQFMAGDKRIALKRNLRNVETAKHNGPALMWAARRSEELRAGGDDLYEDLITHSRQYSLVGPETSLLVLEDIQDYIDANIIPPRNFPKDKMKNYEELLADNEEEKAERLAARLEDVIDIWQNQIEWWNTDFTKIEKPEAKKSENVIVTGSRVRRDELQSPSPVAPPAQERAIVSETQGYSGGAADLGAEAESDEVIVTGSRRGPTIAVEIREWTPDRPYLKALNAAPKDQFETAYREQRALYGNIPAFYLEVADLHYRKRNIRAATQTVLGALDLPAANTQTLSNVANRLLMYGETARAIELYERIVLTDTDRPQPYYDLAMALISRADKTAHSNTANGIYMDALTHLDHVITMPWDGDYDGIELVALMDANAVLAKLPKRLRRQAGFDKKLVKNLDVDVRVVIDWNVDDADIDLRVEEPSGEEVYYGNNRSTDGGQVSNDMTDGYGPEQYLIRSALKGAYRTRSNYYSTDAYNPNGAVAIRARLYKDFGRASQTLQTVIFEFGDDDAEDYILGEIIAE